MYIHMYISILIIHGITLLQEWLTYSCLKEYQLITKHIVKLSATLINNIKVYIKVAYIREMESSLHVEIGCSAKNKKDVWFLDYCELIV